MLLVPLAVGVAAVGLATKLISRPDGRLLFWTWMVGLVVVSFVASIGTQHIMRRFAPLAMLFKMSLVFPDEAPSRFKAAMRSGSSRSLARTARRFDAQSNRQQAAAEALLILVARLSGHDRLTRGHVERVRAYSVMLGEQIGLSRSDLDKLNWAALIHDMGKLDVPESLLNKPGRPTADEWNVLRAHPGAGARYIEPLREWLGEWAEATTQHHERFDGLGYPRGLSGKNISLSGRIVAIADAYDVMTAARSYKKPLPAAQARAELTRNSGTQFDPHLVRSFLEISLGRLRRAVGPVGWLAHLPDLIRTPLTAAATSTTGFVTAGAIGLATVAGAAAPAAPPTPRHESAPYAVAFSTPRSTTTVPPTSSVDVTTSSIPAASATGTIPVAEQSATVGGAAAATADPVPASATPLDQLAPVVPAPEAPTPPSSTDVVSPTTAVPTTAVATTTVPAGAMNAIDDQSDAKNDKVVSIHVLRNDNFAGSAPDLSTLAVVAGPSHGLVNVAGENVIYQAEHGYRGTDSFTYSICSVSGSCDQATVTLMVTH